MSSSGIVTIHGREYKTVALRVAEFRHDHPSWSILTKIVHRDEDVVVAEATICTEEGREIARDYAEEYRAASRINQTSALENCITSAIGRALSAAGYGGGGEYASADEVASAIKQQEASPLIEHNAVVRDNLVAIALIKEAISHYTGTGETGHLSSAYEAWSELGDEEKRALWVATTKGGIFTTHERSVMKSNEWSAVRAAQGDANE